MAASTLDIPKTYADGAVLTEAILDAMSSATETWATATVNNLNQFRLDILGSAYTLDNDAVANNTYPMTAQQTITPSANAVALTLTGTNVTTANMLTITGDALTTGSGISVASSSTSTGTRTLAAFLNSASAATGATIASFTQAAAAPNVTITSTAATGAALNITSSATTQTGVFLMTCDSLTSGQHIFLNSASADATSRRFIGMSNTSTAAVGVEMIAYQNAADPTASFAAADVRFHNQAAAFSSTILLLNATRAANAAYFFIRARSGNLADTEFSVDGVGTLLADGAAYGTPADYAEMFETESGKEIGPGLFVTVNKNGFIKEASKGDYILGIISANPCVLGDAGWNRWGKKYMATEFGAKIYENGERKINPDYDKNSKYTPRAERPEWVAVGMLGKLYVKTKEDITSDAVDVGVDGYAVNGSTYKVIQNVRNKTDDKYNTCYGVVRIILK